VYHWPLCSAMFTLFASGPPALGTSPDHGRPWLDARPLLEHQKKKRPVLGSGRAWLGNCRALMSPVWTIGPRQGGEKKKKLRIICRHIRATGQRTLSTTACPWATSLLAKASWGAPCSADHRKISPRPKNQAPKPVKNPVEASSSPLAWGCGPNPFVRGTAIRSPRAGGRSQPTPPRPGERRRQFFLGRPHSQGLFSVQ